MKQRVQRYFDNLSETTRGASATDGEGAPLVLEDAFQRIISSTRGAHAAGNKIIFIGNGGSAAIASHMAIDFTKNGGMRALTLNDGAALTCLGNDLGYENVFAKQIEMHGRAGDVLFAISSSGRSPNILNGVAAARAPGCTVVTLSGFSDDNPLRRAGDVNLYVASGEYGFVEVSHLALIHAILDLAMGWGAEQPGPEHRLETGAAE